MCNTHLLQRAGRRLAGGWCNEEEAGIMGQDCRCSCCDFGFMGGHSHHEGASSAVCLHCLTEFSLPTESPWGPEVGELIQLFQVRREWFVRHKKKPSICQFHYEPTSEYLLTEASVSYPGMVVYPIETITCPNCHTPSGLVMAFENGATCPKCKRGKLQCSAVMY